MTRAHQRPRGRSCQLRSPRLFCPEHSTWSALQVSQRIRQVARLSRRPYVFHVSGAFRRSRKLVSNVTNPDVLILGPGSITMVDRPCAMSPRDTPRSCGIMPVQRCELDHRAPRSGSRASRATSWSCRPPPRSSPDRAMARQARAACHGRGRVLCPHHDRSWRIDAWPLGAATGGVAHAARALMHGRSPLARQRAARGAGSLRRRRAGGAASARRPPTRSGV